MSNISVYYDASLFSEIAYVRFDEDEDYANGEIFLEVNEHKLRNALTNEDIGGSLSLSQADYFIENYRIVSYQENTDSGFASVVIQKKECAAGEQEYFYACRGTEGINYDDLFSADVGDIVVDGLAIKQIKQIRTLGSPIKRPLVKE